MLKSNMGLHYLTGTTNRSRAKISVITKQFHGDFEAMSKGEMLDSMGDRVRAATSRWIG